MLIRSIGKKLNHLVHQWVPRLKTRPVNPLEDLLRRLVKGHRIGRAIISPIHANFIVNLEGATAQEIYQLMKLAQETVADKFGVVLEPEIEFLGDFS